MKRQGSPVVGAVSRLALGLLGALVFACGSDDSPKSADSAAHKQDSMQEAAAAAREVCQAFVDSQKPLSDEQRCTEDAYWNSQTPDDCAAQRTACLAAPGPAPVLDPLEVESCADELTQVLMGCEASALEVKACAVAELERSAEQYSQMTCSTVGQELSYGDESVPPECEALYALCPQLLEDSLVEDGGFVCNDGQDIIDEYVCDGFADCASSEDESGCPDSRDYEPPGYTEPVGTFVCDEGNEIPGEWRCDGYKDCTDQTDETDCQTATPAEGDGGFVCEDGFDIPDSAYCDTFEDCSNGEDEAYCEDAGDVGEGADGGA